MAHLRVKASIITVLIEQLEAYLLALQAVLPADLKEERLFHMTVTYR
jgi:hypothetical protein